MTRILRASAWSGSVLVPVFFIVLFFQNTVPIDEWFDLRGAIKMIAFLWPAGALSALVLLIPLKPIADHVRPWLSLPLFLIAGFLLPAGFQFDMMQTGAHGNPPPIETEPWTKLSLDTALIGFIGSGCALAAWISLRRSLSEEGGIKEPNKPRVASGDNAPL